MYSNILDQKTEVEQLIDEVQNFSKEGFLNGVWEKRYSVKDIKRIITFARSWHERLRNEYESMQQYASTFNSEFATEDNKYYDSNAKLLRRLRSTMAGSRKMAKDFGRKLRNKYHCQTPSQSQSLSTSKLSHLITKPSEGILFSDFENYDKCVEQLFRLLEFIYYDMLSLLRLCQSVILEETQIKETPSRAKYIYDVSMARINRQVQMTVHQLKGQKVILESVMSNDLRRSSSIEEFACQAFHVYCQSDFFHHCMVENLEYCKYSSITQEELSIFGQDKTKILQMRCLIDNFDQLGDHGRKDNKMGKYKIEPLLVVWLMEWAGFIGTDERAGIETLDRKESWFVEYFNSRYKGEYLCVANSTINEAKNDRNDESAKVSKMRKSFEKNLKRILDNNRFLGEFYNSENTTNRIFAY